MRKLTNSDKQEILKLYRETAETTSTLAERYDVSNSTISRLLKSTLPEDEYEYLVSLKRAARTPEGRAQVSYEHVPGFVQPELEAPAKSQEKPRLKAPEVVVEPSQPLEEPTVSSETVEEEKTSHPVRRVRKRAVTEELPEKPKPKQPIVKQLEIPVVPPTEIANIPSQLLEDDQSDVTAIAQMLGEDLLDESEDDLDDEEDLDEDYEDDEDDFEPPKPLVTRRRLGEPPVQVLPLSVAALPKTCYLVIDRSSELITRPLKDFGDLGQIPNLETQQRTLPVFDNHRVAKRFSTKRDRVIKVPDSKMLHKARTHLQAKGITRLLIDGQVYSLSLV